LNYFSLTSQGIKRHFPEPRTNLDEKRIAVLPFTNLNNDTELEYICNGMAEEIIVALVKVQGQE
jgi:TolB-like protein